MAFTQVAASLYVLARAGNPQLLPAYTQDCSHFAQVTHSLVHRNDVGTHPAGLAGSKPGDVPVEEKGAFVNALREVADDLRAFCAERDVDLDALGRLAGFELVAAGKTVEMLMADDDEKVAFVARAALVDRLYKAILPDRRANEFSRSRERRTAAQLPGRCPAITGERREG